MTLREQVARRLVQVLMESLGAKEQALGILPPGGKISWGTKPDPDVFPSMPSLDFLPVADEVIRQMEWARSKESQGPMVAGPLRQPVPKSLRCMKCETEMFPGGGYFMGGWSDWSGFPCPGCGHVWYWTPDLPKDISSLRASLPTLSGEDVEPI